MRYIVMFGFLGLKIFDYHWYWLLVRLGVAVESRFRKRVWERKIVEDWVELRCGLSWDIYWRWCGRWSLVWVSLLRLIHVKLCDQFLLEVSVVIIVVGIVVNVGRVVITSAAVAVVFCAMRSFPNAYPAASALDILDTTASALGRSSGMIVEMSTEVVVVGIVVGDIVAGLAAGVVEPVFLLLKVRVCIIVRPVSSEVDGGGDGDAA